MKKIQLVTAIILILLISVFSGCQDLIPDMSTTYEAQATKVQYDIIYGYRINITGSGNYRILYRCDLPEALLGKITYDLLYDQDYQHETLGNNMFIRWNISGNTNRNLEIGIRASIEVESYLVSDLNGVNSSTLEEISNNYTDVFKNYTLEQANETTVLIDPTHPAIKSVASSVLNQAKTNNSFVLAKSFFTWLKQNTEYKVHVNKGSVQPASETFYKKTGDCDDLSFLYISLCRAAGIPARFIRGYLLSEDNGEITATAHAWAEVFVGGSIGNEGWIPVECACCTPSVEADINQNFGLENAFHVRLFIDDGNNESLITSLSGISYSYGLGRNIDIQSFNEIENYVEVESKNLEVSGNNIRSYK
jgi:transglutaminase-like putative cysteine protease